MSIPLDEHQRDIWFMKLALEQADIARANGEVPVGAVLVYQNAVIATGSNAPILMNDPSAHAEMRALRSAGQILQNYRMPGCELYVTLEPCAMCAGAIMHARLERLVFAAPDPKTGVAGSVLNLFDLPTLNHHTRVVGGVLQEEAASQLRRFFADRRAATKAARAEAQGKMSDIKG
ncbi:tRNA adenosine(34) deaminase TadA [Burkholderiaceae bacterium DAT-1]|nr:tRNA adenosine(34) deaminase TadA [Burkholderiaceae bacterium DAT-1]